MKIELGNYLIESNELCYTVKIKRVKEASEKTKEENVGEEYYSNIGYYTSLESALRKIPEHLIMTNDDVKEIKEKLKDIEFEIKCLGKF